MAPPGRVNSTVDCIGYRARYHAWMPTGELAAFVKKLASESGFDRCGIAAAEPIGRADYFRAWLNAGRAGSMGYLHRYYDQRTDPRALLDGARSVIVVALSYNQPDTSRVSPDAAPAGRIAMYAWGDDYHTVMKEKLFAMVDRLRADLSQPFGARVCVDTAPLLERELAAAAGIGWIGKNTMVLDHQLGSFFFLGEIVTTLELEPDDPLANRCGSCTACLDACPTDAFPASYEMDASRCISYLTIEHRGEIREDLQAKMGDWIFGCDVCQQVCPYNRQAPKTREPRFAIRPASPTLPLDDILEWTIDDYRTQLRGSAMKRAKLDMLKRNALIARTNADRAAPNA